MRWWKAEANGNQRIDLLKFLGIAVAVTIFFLGLRKIEEGEYKLPLLESSKDEAKFVRENIENISIFAGLIIFIWKYPELKKKSQYEAWQVIFSAEKGKENGGRIQALQDLAKDGIKIGNVDVSGAYLEGIKLEGAWLREADFNDCMLEKSKFSYALLSFTNFSKANLSKAHLDGARLFGANLSGANLSGASLTEANLTEADFSGTDLTKADLNNAIFWEEKIKGDLYEKYEAKNITPEQIKKAQNWEKAIYSPEFRTKLGLGSGE
ncbi:MAG: pentapeptide repeat-containing protein [Rivularia sp. (in: cyanobacteria)]